MRILIIYLFLFVFLFSRLSVPVINNGNIKITDIYPNVAIRNKNTEIFIKGKGFTPNTKVIITPNIIHEELQGKIISLKSGMAAQSAVIFKNKLLVGYGNDNETKANLLVFNIKNNLNPLLEKEVELNLSFINDMFINNNYLYIGDDKGLYVYNLKENYKKVQYIPTDAFVKKIKVKNDLIYFVCANDFLNNNDSDNGLEIYDFNFSKIGEFKTKGVSRGFDFYNNYILIADDDNGVIILDSNLTKVGLINIPRAYDVAIDKDRKIAYIASFKGKIFVYSLDNISNPKKISEYDTKDKPFKLLYKNNNLYVTLFDKGLLILNTDNIYNLSKYSLFPASGETYDVEIKDNIAYFMNGFNGIVVNDISLPNEIKEMYINKSKVNGLISDVNIKNNNVFFAYKNEEGSQGGIVLLDLSNVNKPKYISSFKKIPNVNNLILSYFDKNISLREQYPLQNITFSDKNITLSDVSSVYIDNNLAYVADKYGLVIFDVDKNESLGAIKILNIFPKGKNDDDIVWGYKNTKAVFVNLGYDINISNHLYNKVAIVVGEYGGISLFDVSELSNIKPIIYDILSGIYGYNLNTMLFENFSSSFATIHKNHLYIPTWQGKIFDINLGNLNLSTINSKPRILSIVFKDNYAFLSCGYDGVVITKENNLSDIISIIDTKDYAYSVRIDKDKLYIADGYDGIEIFDINDIKNPFYLDTIKLNGETNRLGILQNKYLVTVSKLFGSITIDKFLPTEVEYIDNHLLKITFPDYQTLGDYNIKVVNENNFSKAIGAITLISEYEANTMPKNSLELRIKEGTDGDVVVDGERLVILNALLKYNGVNYNVFKNLSPNEYQLTSSDASIAKIFGNKIIFYKNGEVTITMSAKGLSDSIRFKVKNLEPIKTEKNNIKKFVNAQAVIIIGHLDTNNSLAGLSIDNKVDKLRFAINKIGNMVYKYLVKFGLSPKNIYYFNPNGPQYIMDIDNDKIKDNVVYNDKDFSWDDVKDLVLNLDPNKDLIFYMIDHGYINEIKISANKTVKIFQLKNLFDSIQQNNNKKILAIFDSCYSGTLLDNLKAKNRTIIASSDKSPTYMSPFGLSFSKYLVKFFEKGLSLKDAFNEASKSYNRLLHKFNLSISPKYYSDNNKTQKISDYQMIRGAPKFLNYLGKDKNISLVINEKIKQSLFVKADVNYPSIVKVYALILPPKNLESAGYTKVINTIKLPLEYNKNNDIFENSFLIDKNGTYEINYVIEDDKGYTYLSDNVYITVKYSAVRETYDMLNIPKEINFSVNLPKKGVNGTPIKWISSNPEYIDSNGNIVRPGYKRGDVNVTLKAIIGVGNETLTKEFNVTIKALPNFSPEMDNLVFKGIKNQKLIGVIKAFDLDDNNLTYSIISTVSHGNLNLQLNGYFEYIPNENFIGIDNFMVKVEDEGGKFIIRKVTLIIEDNTSVSYVYSKNMNKGWNVIGVENINMLNNPNISYAFKYNGKWYFYSNEIKTNKYPTFSKIDKNEGVWVYCKNNFVLNYIKKAEKLNLSNLRRGWNLVSSAKIVDVSSFFKYVKIVWLFKNGKWEFYSSDLNLTKAVAKLFDSINYIDDYDGFWIYKE